MAAWFLWGFQSLWLPASLLEGDAQERLTDALFTGSRYHSLELAFNKGLAGCAAGRHRRGAGHSHEPGRADRVCAGHGRRL